MTRTAHDISVSTDSASGLVTLRQDSQEFQGVAAITVHKDQIPLLLKWLAEAAAELESNVEKIHPN